MPYKQCCSILVFLEVWNPKGLQQHAGAIGELKSTPGAEGKPCYSLGKFKSTARRKKTAAENREVQFQVSGDTGRVVAQQQRECPPTRCVPLAHPTTDVVLHIPPAAVTASKPGFQTRAEQH
ncbi:hypothetical protein Nmel_006092 [Mimus melanotis]